MEFKLEYGFDHHKNDAGINRIIMEFKWKQDDDHTLQWLMN